ncbi:hypothetical protein KCP73_08075 [Salmonella enterica subsp. enterica]|nr:hypothetical protein KCP73_08075 [Salmonella enterica subsp. enterica]
MPKTLPNGSAGQRTVRLLDHGWRIPRQKLAATRWGYRHAADGCRTTPWAFAKLR